MKHGRGRASIRIAISLASVSFFSCAGFAQSGLDPSTRDALIEKFSRVQLGLAPADPSKNAVTLRLADLYAERARVSALDELNKGCVSNCTAGQNDREKALAYYQEVLPKLAEAQQPKVLTQIGHLYELIGDEAKAMVTYRRILANVRAPEAIAEAHLSLGQIYFKRRSYAEARGHFEHVIAIPRAASRGLASYRLAWCEFNEERLDLAIASMVKILRAPELLSRAATGDVVQVDKQFQEEVSRDLATFIARRSIELKDAELVYELSPEHARLANVTYLATEAERLGKIAPAVAIWRFVIEREAKPEQRLEGHVRLAHLEMGQKLQADAIRDFETALALWSNLKACPEVASAEKAADQCKELKSRLRNFVTDWNRVEKKDPSLELLQGYRSYLKVFPADSEMSIWAAKVAADRKLYPESLDLYLSGAKLAQAESAQGADRLEAGVLGAIEAAELSKDSAMMIRAYDAYLEMSRARKKALEVRYQRAHLIYEKGEAANAAEALKAIALDKEPGQVALKKQAADLSLDALVLLKDDARVEAWAREYAQAFPAEAGEFQAIARKSVLTQAAGLGASGAANATGLLASWQMLERFDVAGANDEEKAGYYKNKLILAEKLEKFAEARLAADGLLSVASVATADREYALSRKAWLAELVLDFESALVATEKIKSGANEQRWLKLAMYAELASKDAKPFYSEYLKGSKDEEKSAVIAAQLVRESKEPLKEIERQKTTLSRRPAIWGEAYLEIFARDQNAEVAKRALVIPAVAASAAGKVIARSVFLTELAKFRPKLEAHKVDATTQKKLAQTLRARVAMIEEGEKLAARAVKSGDWTSQLVALDLLAKESERFYQEVLSLPVPQGLSGEDEQQYLSLLSQQAAPHQTRARDVSQKLKEFWASESAITQLDSALKAETGPRRKLIEQELRAIASAASEDKRAAIASSLKTSESARELPNFKEIESARQAVRENPLSRERLEALLALERKLGRPTMVTYLETRLESARAEGAAKGVTQ